MTYTHPNAVDCVMDILLDNDLGDIYNHLPYEYQQLVTEDNPLVQVTSGEGVESSMFRTEDVEVSVYAVGRSAANAVAEQIRGLLHGSVAWETAHGFLDKIETRRVPFSAQYAHDRINKVTAVYMVDTRPSF